MKKLLLLVILFLIYTDVICFCPVVTQWDRSFIMIIQNYLKDIPLTIPVLMGSQLYAAFIALPIIIGFILFLKNKLLIDLLIFSSAPLVAYFLNSIIKVIIQRPRPPFELQLASHSLSFSYVSNHTFVTCSLWGLVIYYLIKYCSNKYVKYIGVSFSILWIFLEGFSRVWLGVHNPTDVIGGYFLAGILLYLYIKLIKFIRVKI